MRRLRTWVVNTAAALALTFLVEALVFAALIRSTLPFERAGGYDLLVVFGGDEHRVQEALKLESPFDSRSFIVSDSTPRQVEASFRAYGRPRRAQVLYE